MDRNVLIKHSDESEQKAMGHDVEEFSEALKAVLKVSAEPPEDSIKIKGHDFCHSTSLDDIMGSMLYSGFQASHLGKAVHEVNRMLNWRLSDEKITEETNEEHKDTKFRADCRCKIFLGYTSNLVSAGIREQIRFLVQHKMVDVLVTTAGGVEEDLIKCLGATYLHDFAAEGATLRQQGFNRIGNLIVPNSNYCAFEDWVIPIFDKMLEEQKEQGIHWTPSKMIRRLGKEINNEESICYWAYKNGIPIYCPALTDGSLGDMLYFHTYKNPGLICDIIADIRGMNDEAIKASPRKTGVIILGGGVSKHHICNANLMRNGANFAVYINTASEYDGSDSGASPEEAISWGKIHPDAMPVKVVGDATILFPLLVSQTFAKQM